MWRYACGFFQNPEIIFYHWQLFNTFYSDTQIRYRFANGLSPFICFASGLSSYVRFVNGLWSFVSFANGLSSFIHFASVLLSFVRFPMVWRLSSFLSSVQTMVHHVVFITIQKSRLLSYKKMLMYFIIKLYLVGWFSYVSSSHLVNTQHRHNNK